MKKQNMMMNQSSTEIFFEKFELLECLKKDNYSSVYIANHIYLGKKIILKTLNAEDLNDKTILPRFKREAKILAKLDHPNLIKVLDFGTFNQNFYLSFEYFKSKNLREVIKQNHLSNEEKIKLLIQLLRALNYAHQNDIIHRDIKPENILVNSDLELKIADFGLATVKTEQVLTQKSSIVGTPSYMSPEQIRGEELNPQSDLFSTGIVAYELFTGINPFLGKDISETINFILNYKENELFEKINTLPDYIQPAIKSMLRKNKNSRAKNSVEVLNLLGIEATVYTVPVPRLIKKNFNKFLAYSSIPVGVVLVLLIILLLNGNFGKDQNPISFFSPADTLSRQISSDSGFAGATGLNDQNEEKNLLPGKLFIECSPWAEVFINNKKVDTTPLKDYISLKPGTYRIRLVHPDFPPITRRVNISSDKIESISVDFANYVGYLDCKINPWGDIYINGELKGTTPLREPIILSPGKYLLTLKNPEFEEIEETISIAARDTTSLKYNFTILNNSSNL